MRNFIFLMLFFTVHLALSQKLEWVKTIQSTQMDPYWPGIDDLQVDSKGHILFSGNFYEDTLQLDENNKLFRSSTLPYPESETRVEFIIKTGSDGEILWSKEVGYSYVNLLYNAYTGTKIAIDSLDNFSPSSDFYKMAKYSSDGTLLFTRDSANFISDYKAFDKEGNIYTTGVVGLENINEVDFDYSPGIQKLPKEGSYCSDDVCFVTVLGKYDAKGNLIWVRKISNIVYSYPKAIKLDSNNNIYMLYSKSFQNYLVKYDNDGNIVWEKVVDQVEDFKLYNSEIYTETSTYDLEGNVTSSRPLFADNNFFINSFTVDGSGIYYTGAVNNTVDFDPGSGVESFTTHESKNFIAKYDLSGSLIWVHVFDILFKSTKIEVDKSGNIILAGEFLNNSTDLDFSANQHIVTADSGVFFIAKYSQPKEKEAQIISWTQIEDKVISDVPFEIQATGGPSGNPVEYEITTIPASGVASIEGNVITILGPGEVTVWATQAGNDEYYPANNVYQTFNISVVSSLSATNNDHIMVFPNPTKSEFNINGDIQSITTIEMTDLQGKPVLLDQEFTNVNIKVSLKENKPGVYILKVHSKEKAEYRKITIE